MKNRWDLVLVLLVLVIAMPVLYLVFKPRKQSVFDSCYGKCIKLGVSPVNGKCKISFTSLVSVKGKDKCKVTEGYCLHFCRSGK